MPSDRERRALRQIRRDLAADNPDSAQSFGTSARLPPRSRGLDRDTHTTWVIVVASVLSLLSMAMDRPISAVAFAAVALVAVARQFFDADKERDI